MMEPGRRNVQNLTIGIVLLALALLVGAVLVVYQFGPDFGITPVPSMEVKAPTDEDATLQITVGGDEKAEELREEARRQMSLENVREMIEAQPRNITLRERETMDDRRRFEHVVRKGETLSSLAREYLGDEKLWQAILAANPGLLRPEDLREGQTILIPTREAR